MTPEGVILDTAKDGGDLRLEDSGVWSDKGDSDNELGQRSSPSLGDPWDRGSVEGNWYSERDVGTLDLGSGVPWFLPLVTLVDLGNVGKDSDGEGSKNSVVKYGGSRFSTLVVHLDPSGASRSDSGEFRRSPEIDGT